MFFTTGPSPNLPQKRTYLGGKGDTLERATPLDKSSQQEPTELTHQALYLNAVQWATVFSSSSQLQPTAQQRITSPVLPGLLQWHDTRERECYPHWTYIVQKIPSIPSMFVPFNLRLRLWIHTTALLYSVCVNKAISHKRKVCYSDFTRLTDRDWPIYPYEIKQPNYCFISVLFTVFQW